MLEPRVEESLGSDRQSYPGDVDSFSSSLTWRVWPFGRVEVVEVSVFFICVIILFTNLHPCGLEMFTPTLLQQSRSSSQLCFLSNTQRSLIWFRTLTKKIKNTHPVCKKRLKKSKRLLFDMDTKVFDPHAFFSFCMPAFFVPNVPQILVLFMTPSNRHPVELMKSSIFIKVFCFYVFIPDSSQFSPEPGRADGTKMFYLWQKCTKLYLVCLSKPRLCPPSLMSIWPFGL